MRNSKLVIILLFLLVAALLIRASSDSVNNTEQIAFWQTNVEQGDSLVMRSSEGHWAFVDAGHFGRLLPQLVKIIPVEQKKIDFIIITHFDADHLAGLYELLDYYDIGKVFWPTDDKSNTLIANIKEKLLLKKVQLFEINLDNDFRWGCCINFNFLWPKTDSASVISNSNDLSVTTVISIGEFSIFTQGDLSSEYELEALENSPIGNVDVIKLGHHGSRTSSSNRLFDILKAKVGLVSAGKDNSYGHPHIEPIKAALSSGIDLYRTDFEGNLQIKIFNTDKYFEVCTEERLECIRYSL